MTTVALYVGPTASNPDSERLLNSLRDFARHRGWTVLGEFVDGGKLRRRAELELLWREVRRGHVEIVAVAELQHLATGVSTLLKALDDLCRRGVGIVSLCGTLDTTTEVGRACLQFAGRLAQAGRNISRTASVLAISEARRRGATVGRPRVPVDTEKARALLDQGWGLRKVAREFGVGTSTLHRALSR